MWMQISGRLGANDATGFKKMKAVFGGAEQTNQPTTECSSLVTRPPDCVLLIGVSPWLLPRLDSGMAAFEIHCDR